MIIFQRVFKLQSGSRICIKNIKVEITQIKLELSFMYATHRHNLFYINMKYHQNIPNGIQVIERTRKCLWTDVRTDGRRTDARLIAISPEPLRSGDKKETHERPILYFIVTLNDRIFSRQWATDEGYQFLQPQ